MSMQAFGGVASAPIPQPPFAATPVVYYTATAPEVAALAAAGTPVPPGAMLIDPTSRQIYGQSDGVGGYQALGGADLDYVEINTTTQVAVAGKAYKSQHTNGCSVELPAGFAKNAIVGAMVDKGSNGGPALFVAGAGTSLESNGTPKVATEGVLMLAVRTSDAEGWTIFGNEAGPVFIGEYATFDELQASAFANGSAALFALPQNSTASIREFIAGTGRGGVLKRSFAAVQADVHWTSDSEIILFQDAVVTGNDVVYPANVSVVGVSSASAGAKTRINMTGHGLTAASDGVGIAVTGGTNWPPGRYPMTYVDANNFDLDVAWNAAYGLPTITKATGSTQITDLMSIPAIPAGMRQPKSVAIAEIQYETSTVSGNKYAVAKHGATQIHNGLIDSTNGSESVRINIRNARSRSAQVQQASSISTSYTKAGAVLRTTVDTAVAQAIVAGIDMPAANIWARVAGATLSVRI